MEHDDSYQDVENKKLVAITDKLRGENIRKLRASLRQPENRERLVQKLLAN